MSARRSGRHQAARSHGHGHGRRWAVLGVIVTGAVVATLAFATTTAAAKILLASGPMTTTGLVCPPSGSASPAACPTAVPAANPDTQAAGPVPPATAGSPATERAPSTTAAPRDPTTAARPSDRETDAGVDWSIAGENVGEGGQVADSRDAIAQMARELTRAMLNERPPNDGHRKNILSSAFHHIGIAIFRDRH